MFKAWQPIKPDLRDIQKIIASMQHIKDIEKWIKFTDCLIILLLAMQWCKMSSFYIFCTLALLHICFARILYAVEQEHFYIHSVNVTRFATAQMAPFYLNVLNTSSCDSLQNVARKNVDGACEILPFYRGMCSFRCRCLDGTASFVVSRKKCIDERGFREGEWRRRHIRY
jgi:hypothetical protein